MSSENTFSGGSDNKVLVNNLSPSKKLNISGSGVTVTDNPGLGRYDIVITGGGSGSSSPLAKGTAAKSGTSSTTVFTIAHSMLSTPVFAIVIPTSTDALGSFITSFDTTNITITYSVPPPTGTGNLTYEWFAMDINGGGGTSPSSGEANTYSTVGTGAAWTLTKSGVNLPFRSLIMGSSKLALTTNTNDLTIDVNQANLAIAYSQLTSIPSTLVQTNQANTYTTADQIIPSSNFKLSNSGFTSSLLAGTLGGNVIITLPNFTTTLVATSDSRLSDSRTPTVHATTHKSGGSDSIKLDELAATTNVTTLNATITAHGLLPILSNSAAQYLDGTGAWSVPAGTGGGGVSAAAPNTWSAIQTYLDTDLALRNPANTFSATVKAGIQTGNVTFTFPVITSTDTIDTIAATAILTNKSIDFSANTATNIANSAISATAAIAKSKLASLAIADADTSTFTSTKISILSKALLNSAIAYNDQANTYAANDQTIPSGNLKLSNSGFASQFTVGTLAGNVTLTLPSITDTVVARTTTDTVTNKTLVLASNTVTDTSAATGDLAKHNGTKFVRMARGTGLQVLRTNSGATDLEYASLNSENTGIATGSGDGSTVVFNVPHSLGSNPSNAMIICSSHIITFTYTTNSTNIIVTFTTAPGSGTNNVIFNWRVVA